MIRLMVPVIVLMVTAGVQPDPLPFQRMAEHIVHALEPVPDERIILRADPGTLPSLERAVRSALARAGASVETWDGADIDGFERRLESANVYVWLPGVSRLTTPDQSAALRKWIDAGGTRRELHFHWSEGTLRADATRVEQSPALDRMYTEALEIDYAALKTRQDAAISLLQSGEVRVTTPAGTDLRFRTGDRPFNRQDGDGSRRRVARARIRIDRHIELPAGIIRVAPIEDSISGVIVAPAMNVKDRRTEHVRLELVKGRVTNAPVPMQFREFGLGFNSALVPQTPFHVIPYYGYGDGVVRLSFGDNEELGGQVRGGAVMWNFFPDATVTVGDRALVTRGRPGR